MVKSKTGKTVTTTTAAALRKKFPVRKCAYKPCGETFTPSRKSQIYHSGECGDKARQERYWIKWRAIVKKVKAQTKRAGKVEVSDE
jgi:hypothetical protein